MWVIASVLVILVVGAAAVAIVSIRGYRTGSNRVGVYDKTFWDWLSILIVPVMLALGGIAFAAYQDVRQQSIEDQRAERERNLAERRAQVDRNIEEQRAQDDALQAYLDQMSALLLEDDLRSSPEDGQLRTLARSRTVTVLGRLDAERKSAVLEFLVETDLVRGVDGQQPVIGLGGADLAGVSLNARDLSGADLAGTVLDNANLDFANLRDADLSDARLDGAVLRDADLGNANLETAYLNGADLTDADLTGANLGGAELGYGARLDRTTLRGTNLAYADLRDALFGGADLTYAQLTSADLRGAYLHGATGLSVKRLEQQGVRLEGATMPDGSVRPGRFAIWGEFAPALSFDLAEGWSRFEPLPGDRRLFREGPERGIVAFVSPYDVFDPTNPVQLRTSRELDTVDEWASWFLSHEEIDASEAVPIHLAGREAARIDVTGAPPPDEPPWDYCDDRGCDPTIAPVGSDRLDPSSKLWKGPVTSRNRWNERFLIVDVDERVVIIDIGAPAGEFDEFLTEAEEAIDSARWEKLPSLLDRKDLRTYL